MPMDFEMNGISSYDFTPFMIAVSLEMSDEPQKFLNPHFSLFASACFQGFSCCDASLRNEGCFFFGSGLPKLASEQGRAEEETMGVALAS